MNSFPKIYLAIDNCVVSKRITKPLEWMEYFKDLGVYYIEASADNELDPFYMGMDYIRDWIDEVKLASQITGQKIVNLFSGHGTYSTLGLGHTDVRVKDHMLNNWLKEMVNIAAELNCGFGFFCHAFPQGILEKPELFQKSWDDLIYRFSIIAEYAQEKGIRDIGVEQMYSPHQVPWTIEQGKTMLSDMQNHTKAPFYITIDTGHQTGQRKHIMPTEDQIAAELDYCRKNFKDSPRIWLGPRKAYQLFKSALKSSVKDDKVYINQIALTMNNTPYMFALYSDGDTYKWLEELSGSSPIVHLQQTDGKSSSHWAFTKNKNSAGTIHPEKIFESIYKFYKKEHIQGSAEPVKEIFLTLEMFGGTAEFQQDIDNKLKETVRYWRKYIPEDGLKLDKLINMRKN